MTDEIKRVRIKPFELSMELRVSVPTISKYAKALRIKRESYQGYRVHDANKIRQLHEMNYKYTKWDLLIEKMNQ